LETNFKKINYAEIILSIKNGHNTIYKISKKLGHKNPTILRQLSILEKAGFLSRKEEQGARKSKEYFITNTNQLKINKHIFNPLVLTLEEIKKIEYEKVGNNKIFKVKK